MVSARLVRLEADGGHGGLSGLVLLPVSGAAAQGTVCAHSAGLSPQSLSSIAEVIERVRELEGIPRRSDGRGAVAPCG
ncbi:hypothetical protein GCM10009753_49800 [Streptantibioticus ferralitis]